MFDFIRKSYFQKNRAWFLSEKILGIIVVCGIILYLRQYLANRSLWQDEAKISLDIIRLSIPDFLHQPLEAHGQAAPPGFLMVEKLSTYLGGTGEYALRLFPFVCGIISLCFFCSMARIYLYNGFAAFALSIFVITPSLVYYSSEVKPYCSDVFWVLFSYVVIAQSCLGRLDMCKAGMMGVLGAVAIWFSFPVVFVLAGIAVTILMDTLIKRDWSKLSKAGIIFSCWIMSFVIFYNVLLRNIVCGISGDFPWQNGYISFTDIKSWLNVFNNIIRYPLGISRCVWLAGFLFFIGGYSFFREDKKKFFLLLTPVFFVFFACGLHQYSCKDRLALFLVPIFLLVIAKGIEAIFLKTGRYRIIITVLLVGNLFYSSFFFVCKGFIKPKGKEEIKQALFYIYTASTPAFEYYAPLYGFSFNDCVFGNRNVWKKQEGLKKDIDKLCGMRRVWLIFSSDQRRGGDKYFCVEYLLQLGGKLLAQWSGKGVDVYLFDLTHFTKLKLSIVSS